MAGADADARLHVLDLDDGLDALEPLPGLAPRAEAGLAGELARGAVGRDDEVRFDIFELVRLDADDAAVLDDRVRHAHVGQHAAAGLARLGVDLLGEPRVERVAEDRVGPLHLVLVEAREVERLRLVARERDHLVLLDGPLDGRRRLEVGVEVVEVVRRVRLSVEDAARDALLAGALAPLQHERLHAVP